MWSSLVCDGALVKTPPDTRIYARVVRSKAEGHQYMRISSDYNGVRSAVRSILPVPGDRRAGLFVANNDHSRSATRDDGTRFGQ
jgi:hypothetical protein